MFVTIRRGSVTIRYPDVESIQELPRGRCRLLTARGETLATVLCAEIDVHQEEGSAEPVDRPVEHAIPLQ